MKFGLMFFAASEDSLGPDKYRLVLDSARFADQAGFSSVWVPERHFTGFGGLYPNPAVLHAGLATCTSRIRLNAGSVVAPLHHPVRIAEEWAVVDNLSNGRVGLSFASGWNPNDFVLAPDHYADRHDRMVAAMETVRGLWRGEPFSGTNGVGQPTQVTTFPRPVQAELPVWLTVAGNPRNFERAGASGAHLLTHLLDQDEAGLAGRIALYRNARAAAGFDPSTGMVSLMIHTLVGADAETVREQARAPYCNYIKANMGLFKGLEQSRGRDVDLSSMSEADLDEFVNFLYERFAASRGLIGTPESCAPLVERLEAIGVNELACLLDFGPHVDLILENLPHLNRLKEQHESTAVATGLRPSALKDFDRQEVLARCTDELTGDQFLGALGARGIAIDGAYRPAATIWRRDGEAMARLSLTVTGDTYGIHPASLDACGRTLAAALPGFGAAGDANYLPSGFETCEVFAPMTPIVWAHAVVTRADPRAASSIVGDVNVYDEAGRLLVQISGLALSAVDGRVTPRAATVATVATDMPLVYDRVWRAVPMPDEARADAARGRWLVVADSGGVAPELIRRLEAHGAECVSETESGLRGIIYLRGLDAREPADTDGQLSEILRVAQSTHRTPVWVVTRGAVAVGEPSSAAMTLAGVAQAPLWGFGRAWAVERPGALGGLVDLDPARSCSDGIEDLLSVITSDRSEDMVALRAGARYVPRLVRSAPVATAPPGSLLFDSAGTILVTGGTGGLGLRLAEWLAARGARHILLCSRRAPGAQAVAPLSRLRASGVDVQLLQADVADHAALSAALESAATSRPLTGVFHLAGVLDDGDLAEQTSERFERVCAPKIAGAWNLHRLTAATPLNHFVLFSSVSSLMPAPGQSGYAAANAFLDGLVHHRRGLGLTGLVVNWGPWADVGHAETDYGRQAHQRLAALGIGAIRPDVGLRVLEGLVRDDRTQAAVASVNWTQLARMDPAAARLGLLADLVPSSAAPTTQAPVSATLTVALAELPEDQRRPYLLQYLSDTVIAALKLRTDEALDPKQRLFDLGLDSIMALELKDRLSRATGVSLSATLLFVYPTLEALCDHLLSDVLAVAKADESLASTAQTMAAPGGEPTEDDLTRRLLAEIEISRGT